MNFARKQKNESASASIQARKLVYSLVIVISITELLAISVFDMLSLLVGQWIMSFPLGNPPNAYASARLLPTIAAAYMGALTGVIVATLLFLMVDFYWLRNEHGNLDSELGYGRRKRAGGRRFLRALVWYALRVVGTSAGFLIYRIPNDCGGTLHPLQALVAAVVGRLAFAAISILLLLQLGAKFVGWGLHADGRRV
ncbi:hypothetical protein C8Q74DRAFT_1443064 [Fomes fomentarius]|nr:hypothetical protein C8Q74DRAFT_1443064 [Fomes fomentarius]